MILGAYKQVPEVVGAEAAAGASMLDGAGRAIFIGVSTGVLVWLTTRLLNGVFPGGGK